MIQPQKTNDKANDKDTNNKISQNEMDDVAAAKIQESEELPSVEQESSHNHPRSVHEAAEIQHSISVDIPQADVEHEIETPQKSTAKDEQDGVFFPDHIGKEESKSNRLVSSNNVTGESAFQHRRRISRIRSLPAHIANGIKIESNVERNLAPTQTRSQSFVL